MRNTDGLLQRIRESRDLADLWADAFEFDVRRRVDDESAELVSGFPIVAIAGDFTGGTFYLCDTGKSIHPVLYASSEGEAGVIAADLKGALELALGFPYWRDCLKYSEGGNLETMKSATEYLFRDLLINRPDLASEQRRVAEALDLDIRNPMELTACLHAVVLDTQSSFIFRDDSGEYGCLFGPFSPSRNKLWR